MGYLKVPLMPNPFKNTYKMSTPGKIFFGSLVAELILKQFSHDDDNNSNLDDYSQASTQYSSQELSAERQQQLPQHRQKLLEYQQQDLEKAIKEIHENLSKNPKVKATFDKLSKKQRESVIKQLLKDRGFDF